MIPGHPGRLLLNSEAGPLLLSLRPVHSLLKKRNPLQQKTKDDIAVDAPKCSPTFVPIQQAIC
jgi:hypothetical protein